VSTSFNFSIEKELAHRQYPRGIVE